MEEGVDGGRSGRWMNGGIGRDVNTASASSMTRLAAAEWNRCQVPN